MEKHIRKNGEGECTRDSSVARGWWSFLIYSLFFFGQLYGGGEIFDCVVQSGRADHASQRLRARHDGAEKQRYLERVVDGCIALAARLPSPTIETQRPSRRVEGYVVVRRAHAICAALVSTIAP